MIKTKFLLVFVLFFLAQLGFTQSDVDKIIKAQAQETARATVEGDYDLLLAYTHPNVIEYSGGKEKLMKVLVSQMEKMAEDGYIIEAVEIGDPISTALYKDEYQTLVPKTMTMSANGQKIISKDYLFGFSDSAGLKWTFIEAQKLKTERAKLIFPDFETNIEIPEKEPPVIIDEDGTEEVLEFDENAGTYQNTDKMVDSVFGLVGLALGAAFLLVVIGLSIFFIIYVKRKKKKETVQQVPTKPVVKKPEKILCTKCEGKNSAEAKYCAFCGHALT